MKKLLTLVFGTLFAFLLFATPGSAEEVVTTSDEQCECHNVTPIFGTEKNKIVANLISSEGFKEAKKEIMAQGIKWSGVNDYQVFRNDFFKAVIVGAPLEGGIMAVFINGQYMGLAPEEAIK